jgi:tRNA U34 2-thiouridine synthase MnmA/TrmU
MKHEHTTVKPVGDLRKNRTRKIAEELEKGMKTKEAQKSLTFEKKRSKRRRSQG